MIPSRWSSMCLDIRHRYVYLGNHHGHSADLRRAGIISCSDDVDDDDIGRARGA